MTSRLGCYWSVEHRRQQDYQYFDLLQPSVFKIMDGGPPDYAFARDNLPNSLVIARDWALSEQHSDMLANPAETGQRHAREWDEHQPKLGFDRAKTLILGINEPTVWQAGFPEALRIYTIALCDEAKRRGLRVGAMQLGVGWPNNNGPDTPPDWSPWHGVEEAILRGNHVLICHEYWADKGPSENWGWWAGRTLKCPWQVPIVIGECGVDMFVKDTSVGQQHRGWFGHMPPERYAAELWEYTSRMSADPRFVGCCVFASDFQAHEWFSFDVEPAYKAILAIKPVDTKPTTPPVTTHLPSIGTGKPETCYVRVASGANIRSTPALAKDNIVAVVPYAEPVTVLGYTDDQQWAQVTYEGILDDPDISGWMSSPLLSPTPMPAPEPTPPPAPLPPPTGDDWSRVWPITLNIEGGLSTDRNDRGNYRPNGEFVGTKYGISANAHPDVDIVNLTKEQALEIYRRDYWQGSGADKLPWPLNLLHFDAYVQNEVAAKKFLAASGGDPDLYMAERIEWYTHIKDPDWTNFSRGWMRRCATMLREASKA